MVSEKTIRIILTGIVLLAGGYYIQKSATSLSKPPKSAETQGGVLLDTAHADTPVEPPVGK